MLQQLDCEGTRFEVSLVWPNVSAALPSSLAAVVLPFGEKIKKTWPDLPEEMQALKVRTEIAFGKFSDGYTSLA
uniref:MHC class II regulatory factor RFX1 n=1 Tax=Talaromyces marneffei PM1 TaxID=1077442 RepID=A0A093VF61_TALMA